MQDFIVLNLLTNENFNNVLKEVSVRIKVKVIQEVADLNMVDLVFTDIEHTAFISNNNGPNIVGIIKSSADINNFYDQNIFHTIPIDIGSFQLEAILNQQIDLRSIKLLQCSVKMNETYSFDDFIYYADNVFMHSTIGIAFLTKDLEFLLFNSKFSAFFHNIYNEFPVVRQTMNVKLNKGHQELWGKIISEGSSFEGKTLEIEGKVGDESKHYDVQITPIYKLSKLIGYTVIIRDISQFVNVNADLKKYYQYLIEQNSRLEKAYKEAELNNEKLKIAYEKVNALSNRDYLTQAPNRKYFLEKIEYEQLRFKRTATPFILAYGDIDDFKKVNDNYGHETGDYILISLTNLIKNTIRNIDFFCRWGGEEFLIFLAEPDQKIGKTIIERLLKVIRNFDFNYNGNSISITMTFGLAVYEKDQHINQIIDLADQKLYWGKKNNKNQVVDVIPDE